MICEKCGYEPADKEISGRKLCSFCNRFAPKDKLEEYLSEKVDWKILETFRRNIKRNISGMKSKAEQGKVMNRAAFGYRLVNKELIIDQENRLIVEDIFRNFLENDISLNQLSKKYNFSVNGIKKILKNFTYIGKIKFEGQILQGNHQAIISSELFNKVQSKLENLGVN